MRPLESGADAAGSAGRPVAESAPASAPPGAERYVHGAGIIETDLGEELILLDPTTQQMFSLNGAGRLIWNALEEGTPETVVDRVVAGFDVAREIAEADVRELLRQLLAAGLIASA